MNGRPARKVLCDLGPTVAKLLVKAVDYLVFSVAPGTFLDLGIEMIVPSSAHTQNQSTYLIYDSKSINDSKPNKLTNMYCYIL